MIIKIRAIPKVNDKDEAYYSTKQDQGKQFGRNSWIILELSFLPH